MTFLYARRTHAVTVVLLAALAGASICLNAGADAADAARFGLLALGLPKIVVKPCALCTQVRESASDYEPVEHFMGGPRRIILMRHADKTDDSDDEDLSEAGSARAKQLATYLPQTFGKPDIIIAAAKSKHSDRSFETVKPLADQLGLQVQHYFKDKEFGDLVEELFNDPDYKNKTVVICWHHGKLPAMAALLGAPAGSYPDPWPSDAFNLILDFQYDPFSGSPPKVTRVIEPF